MCVCVCVLVDCPPAGGEVPTAAAAGPAGPAHPRECLCCVCPTRDLPQIRAKP